jgi:hypothetical protein
LALNYVWGGKTALAHVTALAQHILALEPDKDAARLCFYHFLKNLCEATEPINSELLNRFYFRALSFSHWQTNKDHLFGEVSAILQHFQDTHRLSLPLEQVMRPEETQIVPLESLRTLELVVEKHLRRNIAPFDQYRILSEGPERVIAIVLQGDRSLRLTVYPKVAIIREGELLPLNSEFTVHYTADLVLNPALVQTLEIGPHTSARFRLTNDGLIGKMVRGYTFQKFAVLDGGTLHKYPMIFYPLKRLEQFFVNRKTDPMYMELTSLLEKALDLMNSNHPDAVKFAEAALDRGRLALEHIFPDDKLVRLLIINLEKTLALAKAIPQPGNRSTMNDLSGHLGATTLEKHLQQQEVAPEGTYLISDGDTEDSLDPKDEAWPQIRNLPV